MPDTPERREHRFRRDINDLVRSPDGKVSEGKVWANLGKATAIWLLIKHTDGVLSHPDALAILLIVVIVPDLLKKFVAMKYGANGKAP